MPENAGGDDLRVVYDEQVALFEIIGKVAKIRVLHAFVRTRIHKKPARVARFDGRLSNELFRKVVIKIVRQELHITPPRGRRKG